MFKLYWDDVNNFRSPNSSKLVSRFFDYFLIDIFHKLIIGNYEIHKCYELRSIFYVIRSTFFQLQEKLIMVTQAQDRTKDMQNRMEVAWERERSEQKRLLAEAHGLALDLQSQLKARDNEYARDRRMLLDQLKRLRTEIDEEQLCRDSRLSEVCTNDTLLSVKSRIR